HQGSLEFPAEQRERILGLAARVPTVVDVFLDRPAVLAEIAAGAAALVGSFGASDAAVRDLGFGRSRRPAGCRSRCPPRWMPGSASSRTCPTTRRRPCSRSGTGSRTESARTYLSAQVSARVGAWSSGSTPSRS